jgi:hypothetical protein
MKDSAKPIRSESARFLVGGTRKGQGVVLLYPDKLAKVSVYAEMWGYFVGPLVVAAAAYPIVRTIGSFPEGIAALQAALGVTLGGAIGRAVDRGLAAKAVADGPKTATIIPLDMVASLQTFRSTWLGGRFSSETLVVTTADGTQYGFRGRTGHLQNDIAGALAGLGREVRATTTGLAVTARALNGEG